MQNLLKHINYPTVAQEVLIKDANLFSIFCENEKVSLNQELTNFLLKDTSDALHLSKACKLTLSYENFDTFIENEDRVSIMRNLIISSDLTEKQLRTILNKFNSPVTLLQAINVSKFNKGKAVKVSDFKNTDDLRVFDQWLMTVIDKSEHEEEILNYLTQTKFINFERDKCYGLDLLRKFVRFKPHLQDKILKLNSRWFNVSLVDAIEIKNLDLESILIYIYGNAKLLSSYTDFADLLVRNIFIDPYEIKKIITEKMVSSENYALGETFQETAWFSPHRLLDFCDYRISNNVFVEPGAVLTKSQLQRFRVDVASLPWFQKQPNFKHINIRKKRRIPSTSTSVKLFECKSVLRLGKFEAECINDLFLEETKNFTTPQWEILFSLA